jgi:photoactive yellow protein
MFVSKFLESVDKFLGTHGGVQDGMVGVEEGLRALDASSRTLVPPFMGSKIDDLIRDRTDEEVNAMPYGAIELDKSGAILRFNDAEAELSGLKPEEVVGLNFFTEVAPCTRRPEFLGRFLDGVRRGDLNALFEFTFDGPVAHTRVWVSLKKAPRTETYWCFIKRM